MNANEMLQIMAVASRLKNVYRHCYTENGRRESVADHSWRAALMAMLLSHEPEYAELDMNKVVRMCLIHDLGEAFTGDIPTFLKKGSHEEEERQAYYAWIGSFPEAQKEEWQALLEEMEEMRSQEAKLFKALDKLEAVISHDESEISTWLPLEYDLQMTYGTSEVSFSPYMKDLKAEIDRWTSGKIRAAEKGEDDIVLPPC